MEAFVLIVDDDPALRFAFVHVLSKAGYGVAEAACLEEARKIVLRQRFDAVILDLHLPDGNGLDLIPDWKKSHREMVIVVVSGLATADIEARCRQLGVDDFHRKPVSLEDFSASLHKLLMKYPAAKRIANAQSFI